MKRRRTLKRMARKAQQAPAQVTANAKDDSRICLNEARKLLLKIEREAESDATRGDAWAASQLLKRLSV